MRSIFKVNPKRIRNKTSRRALIALLAVSIIAGSGAYQVWSSSATTVYRSEAASTTTSEGCQLTGRKWVGGKCSTTCIQTSDKFISGTNYIVGGEKLGTGYCPGAIQQTVTRDQCNGLGRRWVYSTGCTRQINQTSNKLNSIHCIDPTATYMVPANSCVCPSGMERDASNGRCVPKGTASVVYTGTDTTQPKSATVSAYSSTYNQAVHDRINLFRSNAGVRTLRESSCLQKFAVASAKRMAENDDMTHASNLGEALRSCGGTKVGENIAAGFTSPIIVCQQWYYSDGHRRNMLEPQYTTGAVASYTSKNGKVYTASWFLAI